MTISAGMLQLDGLLFFDAAMRHMSFVGAAAELNVTPSAVSQRIKSLEASLGVSLFTRQARGLVASEAARLYLLEIRPALERLRTASARLAGKRARRPPKRGRQLSVDVLPALVTTRIALLLPSFTQHFPDVELRLTSSQSLSDPIRDGFDCCLRYGPGGWPGVRAELLSREEIFPVCSPKLMPRPARELDDEETARLPRVHDMMPIGWPEWFASRGVASERSRGPVFSDSAVAQRAAVEGLGIALARSVLAAPDLAEQRLVRLSGEHLMSPFSYWLVRPVERIDTLVDLFADWLRAELFAGMASTATMDN